MDIWIHFYIGKNNKIKVTQSFWTRLLMSFEICYKIGAFV